MAALLAACVTEPGEGDLFGPVTAGPSPGDGSSGTTDGPDSGGASSGGEAETGGDESTGEPLPPFSCDAVPASSPVLDALVLLDPAQPHPGDTLNVVVRATNGTSRGDAPPMELEVSDRDGVSTLSPLTIQGGEALYYYSIPDVPQGDLCLRSLIDGATEASAKVTVTPRPPGPPVDGGIFKVRANHQWTCDEQPGWGNELHVWVRDENGQAMEGVSVAVGYADSTDPGSIYNGDGEPIPSAIVTGADGHGMIFDYWPISDNGLLVLELQVDGVASDIATELTTGWWEDDTMGCNYCNTATVNVWGHWSYTVEFQRDPAATEVCVVDNDHAGMAACGNDLHVHHAPGVVPCWAP
ncbi:MAG: hypothetical protein H6712_12265 [Myxococcales bacterium]|nr:hypothetical protein [Myxococcales bacterium]MCB9714631.1 hypothetical protein [Myxococcales bacterium]